MRLLYLIRRCLWCLPWLTAITEYILSLRVKSSDPIFSARSDIRSPVVDRLDSKRDYCISVISHIGRKVEYLLVKSGNVVTQKKLVYCCSDSLLLLCARGSQAICWLHKGICPRIETCKIWFIYANIRVLSTSFRPILCLQAICLIIRNFYWP